MKQLTRMLVAAFVAALMAVSLAACNQGASSSSESVSASSSASESASAEQVVTLDWVDGSDRALVNEKLRWMAQAFWTFDGTEVDLESAENLAALAVSYIAANDYGSIEPGDFTSVSPVGGGAGGTTNMRVSAELVASVAEGFTGIKPDFTKLDGQGRYDYVDGYIYFGTTAPLNQSSGYSAADGLEELGDGRYKATFAMLESSMPYEVPGPEFYAQSADEMLAAVDDALLCRTGEAVIRVSEDEGANGKSVVFESYVLSPREDGVASGGSSANDSANAISCEAFKVELPADLVASVEADWPQEYCLSLQAGDVKIAEIRCLNAAPQYRGGEAKQKPYKLGSTVAKGASDEVIAKFFYINPSGGGNAHWNNAAATELAVEKYLGMTPEELLSHVSLRNIAGDWVPVTNPVYEGGD